MSLSNKSYQNPVTRIPSADPFVLKHAGEYWAYVTGKWQDGRCFGILHSEDLVNWEVHAGALPPLDPPPGMEYTCYWAPEVTYENGIFYLYYSVGNEAYMHIRVATSTEPGGPFVDSGHQLTTEQFAIDAHVFIDEDGARYLFYAADFLDHSHIGTGIVVDRMLDPFHLAGSPQPAARARFDWQVYHPNRPEKGGVRWHTVEGPFVLKHKGRYYLMFSGGNWQNDTYGLGYAVSERMDADEEWKQPCDGEQVMPVLKSNQAQGVIGPGHNSVVRGPDNRQLFCVYHRWDPDLDARVMSIDRLEWIGDRLAVLGPSIGVQAVASVPDLQAGSLNNPQVLPLPKPARPFLMEGTLRSAKDAGKLQIHLQTGAEHLLALSLDAGAKEMSVKSPVHQKSYPLSPDFRLDVDHLLRLEVNGRLVSLQLDGTAYQWSGVISSAPHQLILSSDSGGEYRGLTLTPGWQDTFEYELSPAELGWKVGQGDWQVRSGQLQQMDASAGQAKVTKPLPLEGNYEFVVNVCVMEEGKAAGSYSIYPAAAVGSLSPAFSVRSAAQGWELVIEDEISQIAVELPGSFDPFQYQHFRFRVIGNELQAFLETILLHTIRLNTTPSQIGLGTGRARAAFDLVRVSPW
jgi:GH43 family beta-xylosidase